MAVLAGTCVAAWRHHFSAAPAWSYSLLNALHRAAAHIVETDGRTMTEVEKEATATEPPPETVPVTEPNPETPEQAEQVAAPTPEPETEPPSREASEKSAAIQWKDKANAFLATSSKNLAAAATKATTAVAGAADVSGKTVRTGWETTKEGWQKTVQPRVSQTLESTKEGWATHVQPKVEAGVETALKVAADTGDKIRKNTMTISQRVAEETKNSLERSRSFLIRMEILPPEAGTPGLVAEYLFEDEGDSAAITKLMRTFDRDTDRTTLPPSTSSKDVAQLLLAFFRCLPEPLLTYQHYAAVVEAGGNPVTLQLLVRSLPLVNRATLDCLMQLLDMVARAKEATKMDATALATEWAPVLLWRNGTAPSSAVGGREAKGAEGGEGGGRNQGGGGGAAAGEKMTGDAAAVIDGSVVEADAEKAQKAILAATICLIEHYGAIFGEKALEEEAPPPKSESEGEK